MELVRILLRFSADITDEPITSSVILEEKVHLNILSAHIDQRRGEILVEVPTEEARRVIEAFRDKGVEVEVRKLITVDKDLCIDCGSCYSLCPVEAITIKGDYEIIFDEDKCIGSSCGLCVDSCPMRAIKLIR